VYSVRFTAFSESLGPKMFGGKKQILFVGNDALHHYVCRGSTTVLQEEYYWDQADLVKTLSAALQNVGRNAPVMVMLDQAEQQYRKEVLPKVSFIDRARVTERKLAMTFPQLPYRAALGLKKNSHDASNANEPSLLLAGVPQTPELGKVIQAITDSDVLFSGLYLVPTESTTLINRFIKLLHERTQVIDRPRWTVLLTQQKTGGLRQIVLQDGQLALTRLTPLFVANEQELGNVRDVMVREFQATLNYLVRFGYVAADGIDVIVVTSEMLGEALQQVNLPVTHLYTLSVAEAARVLKAGPKGAAADTLYSDSLLSALIATQRPVMPLQNVALKPLQSGRKAVRMMTIGLFAVALGLLSWVLVNQSEISDKKAQIEIGENDFRVLQVRYNDLAKKMNTLKYLPEMVQAVLNVRDELVKTNLNTEPTVQAIVSIVDKGTMTIKNLTIQPLKLDPQNAGGPAPAPPLVSTDPAFPPRITVTLELGFPSNDMEQGARLTEQLAVQLRSKFTQHNIRIVKTVGNLSVNNTVQGLSQQVSKADLSAPQAKSNETSVIEISGAAL
jgi:hypothetical protein